MWGMRTCVGDAGPQAPTGAAELWRSTGGRCVRRGHCTVWVPEKWDGQILCDAMRKGQVGEPAPAGKAGGWRSPGGTGGLGRRSPRSAAAPGETRWPRVAKPTSGRCWEPSRLPAVLAAPSPCGPGTATPPHLADKTQSIRVQ